MDDAVEIAALAGGRRFFAVDFEGTGVVPGYPNEPWQIGIAPIANGGVLFANGYESLLKIGDRPFNRYAPGRHALLRDELANSPTMNDIFPDVSAMLLGHVLVAHNDATERGVLAKAYPLHSFGPWIDTLRLARKAWPGLESYALEDLMPWLGLQDELQKMCPGKAPHDAYYDAVACGVLLLRILREPGWSSLPLSAFV